ncbi:MAG: ndh [Herminiimonas sp.]|nr:ndh [Herminiimonas sp.]MDB5854207.1 ndh [Herminiimonas sp.]
MFQKSHAKMEAIVPVSRGRDTALNPRLHRIVVVGGGAGGLELATRLGDYANRGDNAKVVLVDRSATHLWKPLLHEVAAGSMDANAHQLDYVAQARWHHFEFQQGDLIDLDRASKVIRISAVSDQDGTEILPMREIPYDTLVLAIGSVTNFFGVPGAAEHAMAVDTVQQAEQFRRRLIAACMRTQNRLADLGTAPRPTVDIAIVGGGATGVELSAELRGTAQTLGAYGLHHLHPTRDIRITIIEAGPRILPPLPERIATETARLLNKLDITILAGEKVSEVRPDAVLTASGKRIPSTLTVWAGGIRVGEILERVGLPVNKLGQVIVSETLQTIVDPDIFALGDCASCPWPEQGKSVPPRAQAAHQQASFLYGALCRRLQHKPLRTFHFQDHGSLVSLGRFDTLGNLMGKVIGRSMRVEGILARFLYISLYRMHLMALHGFMRMALDTLAQWLRQKTAPRVKLH